MQTIEVPFAEWTPDTPNRSSGATVAKGVISAENSYRPIPDAVTVDNSTITARAQGGSGFYSDAGNAFVFVGDNTKLYQLESGAWTNRSGASYTIANDDVWQFEQFGQKIVAVNGSDAPQVFDMDLPGNFSALGGAPPRAHRIGRIGDFLVVGNITSPVQARARVQWCAIDDITTWTATASNQADFQDLSEDAGAVNGIFNLFETGFLFQERAITRMSYEGLPTIFRFDVVERNRGAIIGGQSMIRYGSMIFYIAEDGLFAWDGTQSIPISDNKVARYFINNLNFAYRFNTFAAFDHDNRAVWWAYPSGDSQVPDSLLIFSLKDNRWSYDSGLDLEMLFNTPAEGLTLEDMDAISASIDSLPLSLDSAVYQSSGNRISGFNTSHNFLTFTGDNRAAQLETGEFQPQPGQIAYATELWPLVSGGSPAITGSIGARAQMLGDNLAYTTAASPNGRGKVSLRARGRFMRAKLAIAAAESWTHMEGVQVKFRVGGRR